MTIEYRNGHLGMADDDRRRRPKPVDHATRTIGPTQRLSRSNPP